MRLMVQLYLFFGVSVLFSAFIYTIICIIIVEPNVYIQIVELIICIVSIPSYPLLIWVIAKDGV